MLEQQSFSPPPRRRINLAVEIARSGRKIKEIAKEAGIHRTRLSQIKNGLACPPTQKQRKKLSNIFGKSERWLFKQDRTKEK